jgi:pimeloyl-ACP methyl ester carboxylesterase
MKKVMWFIVALGLVYVALCAVLFLSQRSMLYFPRPESSHTRAEVLRFDSAGVTLKIWHLARTGERAILYFGGNAEDVAWNIDEYAAMFPDSAVFLVNYRGYGGSAGAPSEAALLADAEAVFDYVRARHPRVAVIGRSLGSGVAVHLASVRDVDKLVLVTPYDSVESIAKAYFSLFPVSLLLRDKYDSFGRAAKIKAPILLLVAEHDSIIPRAHSDRLATAFTPALARVQVIAGATHDSIGNFPEYRRALRDFLLAADP